MPRKKINEEEVLIENGEKKKISSTEKKVAKTTKKTASKTVTSKVEKNTKDTKALPKAKEKKSLPKLEDKKALPKATAKKALPKSTTKKALPKVNVKKALPGKKKVKELPEKISDEEKDLRLLEKIKEFFSRNPDKTSVIDSKVEEKKEFLAEYYDLPYRYNETVVRILAQTPKRLFIYWDVSDNDVQRYRRAFGDDFFEKTYPVLLVHNDELNYTYEVPINDFANSWYLDIKDPKSNYSVQLGRKFREAPRFTHEVHEKVQAENINLKNDYIEIVNSNRLEAPNDHVLFESMPSAITYRNVKTHQETTKEIKEVLKGFAQVYNVYDLYNIIYKDEMESSSMFDLNNPGSSRGNPTSGNPSSGMTSGMFR